MLDFSSVIMAGLWVVRKSSACVLSGPETFALCQKIGVVSHVLSFGSDEAAFRHARSSSEVGISIPARMVAVPHAAVAVPGAPRARVPRVPYRDRAVPRYSRN